jgi:UDP-N-acetylglucosamine 2-epimerase (hydrolysing)
MKKILFLTGTRADYGKLKSLINTVEQSEEFEAYIYVTGMHMLNRYGYTAQEVIKDGYKNIYMNINQHVGDHMEIALANTVQGLSHYVHELKPDLLIIHGDRLEALAGAIVGAFTNTLVGHIEGGELSGTIDDSIRHSVSKMAHIHFVCNDDASQRLIAMGENKNSIFLIGSPDYDVMFNQKLPSLSDVKEYYEIGFDEFGIVLFHPVTTDSVSFESYSDNLVKACI